MRRYVHAHLIHAPSIRVFTGIVLVLLLAHPAMAAVTFNFNYTDPLGVGFNASGSTGADRRAGLAQAGDYLSGLLVNYNATINIDVNGTETDDFTLAGAASNFNAPIPSNGFGDQGDVMIKILNGDAADPSPGVADGDIIWNFQDFNWEPLNDFQLGELDLISTAIHELTHTLGFVSDIFEDGSSFFDPPGVASIWAPFDEFVADSTGAIINNSTFILNSTRWDAASVGGTGPVNGLLFNGPNATAANGGNPVPLYSPSTWEEGSSGSHTDTDFFTSANTQLMNSEPSILDGLDIRTLSPIELGMLQDIGYTLLVTALTGDLDGDGFVGINDLNIVLANWNQNIPPGDPLADPSGDGFVGIDDLNEVLGNWNAGTPPSGANTIPEPGSVSLLALLLLGHFTCRKRIRAMQWGCST